MAANNIVFDIDKVKSKITTPYSVESGATVEAKSLIAGSGSTHGMRLAIDGNGNGYIQSGQQDKDATDQKLICSGWYGTPLTNMNITMKQDINPKVKWGNIEYSMYHEGFRPSTLQETSLSSKSCNDAIESGFYSIFSGTTDTPFGTGPSGSSMIVAKWGSNGVSQTFYTYNTDRVFVRRLEGGVWKDWFELYSTAKKPTPADIGTLTTTQINTELSKKSDLTYVNTELGKKADKSYTDTELGKKLNLSGGTMTGAITVANMKSAVKVDNQKSISFQDQSGTMYHLLSEGNNFKIKHGNNAENPIFDISSSTVAANTSFYSRTGMIVQDTAGTKWLGLETPSGTDPYISVRSVGDTQNRVAMKFEKGAIRVVTDTLVSPSMMVQNNGGLVFSPQTDRAGLTWGMGIDPASGDLNFHRYNNGNWAALPLILKGDGTLHAVSGLRTSIINCTGNAAIDGSLAVIQSIDVRGGYMSLTATSNTLLEFHTPMRSAAMIYKGPEGDMRFVTSNGAGGETSLRMVLHTNNNMTVNGEIFCSKVTQTSDIRLKSNVVKLDRVLDRCAVIDTYSYEKGGSREVGVIAQDVAFGLEDAVGHTEVDGEERLTVNYGSIAALSLAGVNELHAMVKELREEIEELKSLNLISV